jgi:hypothetical protein
MLETTEQVKKVPNPNGIGGFGDNPQNRNNGGRVPNPLKEFQREEFANMTPDEKRNYLKEVDKYKRWTMAEGAPDTKTDITTKGEKITIPNEELEALAKQLNEIARNNKGTSESSNGVIASSMDKEISD